MFYYLFFFFKVWLEMEKGGYLPVAWSQFLKNVVVGEKSFHIKIRSCPSMLKECQN